MRSDHGPFRRVGRPDWPPDRGANPTANVNRPVGVLPGIRGRIQCMAKRAVGQRPVDQDVRGGGTCRYVELERPYGHMACGIEWGRLQPELRWMLDG